MNFNFGNNPPKTTSSVTFGAPSNPAATTATGFSLANPAGGAGLTFGAPPSSVPGFSLGGGAGDSKSTGNLALPAPTATVKPVAATAPLSFSLGAPATTTSSSSGFPSFGLTATTSAPPASTPSFSFGATSTPSLPTTSSTVSFSLTPTTSTLKLGVTTAATTAPAVTTGTALSTTASTVPAALPANITFVQLEETINKWTSELQEQEKMFMSQAAQITNWDNLLNSNSDKIVALNADVAAMKLQQQQLDHELDFIVAQQRELEEVLIPLEKQTAETPSNTDPEREHIYHMAETLDTQVKQMSEDLKEIIEHINESSRTQDNSDPIVQIGRILNAHMNSLHWIDQMTLNIQNQLENVTKLHDAHRRENERSFRISYE